VILSLILLSKDKLKFNYDNVQQFEVVVGYPKKTVKIAIF
jgi:hypothetical protein